MPEIKVLRADTGKEASDIRQLPVARDWMDATEIKHAYHCFPRGDSLGRAIRTDRYRLVEWKKIGAPADTAQIELYDYADDPVESRNIAAEQPAIVTELRAILATHPEPRKAVAAKPR